MTMLQTVAQFIATVLTKEPIMSETQHQSWYADVVRMTKAQNADDGRAQEIADAVSGAANIVGDLLDDSGLVPSVSRRMIQKQSRDGSDPPGDGDRDSGIWDWELD